MRKNVACSLLTILFLITFSLPQAFAFRPISSKNPPPSSANSMSGIYPEYPAVNYGEGTQAQIIKRGEYLAKSADCLACHTNVDGHGKPFAGGLPIKTPFGTFYSTNITPDKETGIGNWSFEDFKHALHDGKNPKGQNYFPVFPYLYFSKISEQDLRDMWEYFKAIPAVKSPNRAHDVPFPFNVRFAQLGWKILFFYPYSGYAEYDHTHTAVWNRGKYLVDGAGHCSMCHTPINLLGGAKRRYYLTGAFVDGFWCPNITGEGLKTASTENIENVFRKDDLINDAGKVAGPMAEVNHDSLQYMTKDDLFAIATYLKTVESVQPMGVRPLNTTPSIARGRQIYNRACSNCHTQGQGGAPLIGDDANFYARIKNRGLNGFYRNVINGFNSMPIRGGCVTCSDEDIESAVNYLMAQTLTRAHLEELMNPKPRTKPTVTDGKQIYDSVCATCHANGALGAPIVGDKKAWEPLIAKNMDELIESTLNGSQKMPPRGGCKYCSTSEVIAAVKYMVQQSKTQGNYSLW